MHLGNSALFCSYYLKIPNYFIDKLAKIYLFSEVRASFFARYMKIHLNLANNICKIMDIVIKQLLVEELGSLRFHGYCILSLLTLFAVSPFEFWYHYGAKERCNFKIFIGNYFLKFIPKSNFKSALSTVHSA